MEPSAALNLPLEVLDVIFQLLRDNTESLKACLLVNRAFLNIVESHLYHHIDIYFGYRIKDGQSTLPVSKLSDLLYGSPHISHHIRSLRIVFPPLPSMVQGDEGLSTILPRLQRLRMISLTTHYHWVLWRTIPEPLQAALLVTIQSSNTEEVDIELVDDFPLQSLNECSNLRKLSFSRIESFRPEDAQTDAAIGRDSPCVKSLAVGYCASALPNLFGWLLAPTPQGKPMISSLRSFVFRTINSQDMKWLVPMLNACLKTLVSLEFDASEIFYTPAAVRGWNGAQQDVDPIVLSLSDAHSLETLTIRWVISNSPFVGVVHYNLTTQITSICGLLKTLPMPSAVQHINILTFSDDLSANLVDWSILEETIHCGRLRSLIKLELTVFVSQYVEDQSKAIMCRNLREDAVLSRLIHRGLISVSVE